MNKRLFVFIMAGTVLISAVAGCSDDDASGNRIAPVPGVFLPVLELQPESLVLHWTAAGDEATPVQQLLYSVYHSTVPCASIETVRAQAAATVSDAAGITQLKIGGLTPGAQYYFYIIVSDHEGNSALYPQLVRQMPVTGDGLAPQPGNSGVMATASVQQSSVRLTWNTASDETSPSELLRYRVFYTDSGSAFNSVADIEAYGIPAGDWVYNTNALTVSGLQSETRYRFNVIVSDQGGNRASYQMLETVTDGLAPVAGDSGTVTVTGFQTNSVSLSWTAAVDNYSVQSNLQYQVYYSTMNNVSSLAGIEANGTAAGGLTAGTTSLVVSGLSPSTLYYFNVVVQDETGNRQVYSGCSQMTADGVVPVAGNSGTLTTAAVMTDSMTLHWTAASDDISAQNLLQYLLYYSTSDNLNSVADMEANGTAVGTFAADINMQSVTGLAPATLYYFNVLVKDEAGNKAAYTPVSQTTAN